MYRELGMLSSPSKSEISQASDAIPRIPGHRNKSSCSPITKFRMSPPSPPKAMAAALSKRVPSHKANKKAAAVSTATFLAGYESKTAAKPDCVSTGLTAVASCESKTAVKLDHTSTGLIAAATCESKIVANAKQPDHASTGLTVAASHESKK